MKWAIALVSIILAIGVCEVLLRVSLFHSSIEFASQDPEYYARTLDELWIYRQLFSRSKRWTVGAGQPDTTGETRIEFYRKWPTSLTPDKELGYVRKADVRTPCHETTNFGTRGTHDYASTGRKIVFFGDSFVESAACSSDTLASKVEAVTIAQVIVRLRIVEPESERLSIRRGGRLQLSGCVQCIAEVVVRLRQIRVARQRAAASGSRLVKATLAREHHSQVAVVLCRLRTIRDGPPYQVDGGIQLPRPMGEHPKQMQGFGVLRLDAEDLTTHPFGIYQSSTAVVLQCQVHLLLNRHRAHRSILRYGLFQSHR